MVVQLWENMLHCSFTIGYLIVWRPQLYIHNMLTKHKHLEVPQAHARLLFARFPSTSNNISSEREDLFLSGKSGYLILHVQLGACNDMVHMCTISLHLPKSVEQFSFSVRMGRRKQCMSVTVSACLPSTTFMSRELKMEQQLD